MESSSKRKFAEMHESIPDDVYEAALAASQQDSDGEDPFGPQPKRFMQTEHQEKRQKRELYIRQVALILRLERKDQSSRFRKLPSELILKLMQHIDLSNLLDLANSSMITQCIFRANETAIYRGMEIEQFSDWKWIFGNTVHRTSAQVQHLKDAISVEYFFGATGLPCEERLLELLRIIDNKKFTGIQNVMFLQDMQDRVDTDIDAIESYTTKQIARRTAICLRSLGFQRPIVVKEEDRRKNGPLVHCQSLPWEERSELIAEQPASIQAEIRSLLMIAVQKFYCPLQAILKWWTRRYYSNPGNHRKPQEVKTWMSKLVTGLILQDMAPQWYSVIVGSSIELSFEQSLIREVHASLIRLFKAHDTGSVDVLKEVEDALQFGRSIGIDLEGLVDGTSAGNLVDRLGSEPRNQEVAIREMSGNTLLDARDNHLQDAVVDEVDADLWCHQRNPCLRYSHISLDQFLGRAEGFRVEVGRIDLWNIYDQAHAEAQSNFEHYTTAEAREELYNTATKRYKEEVEAGAHEKVLKELEKQVRKEVAAEYQEKLEAGFEQQWTDSKRAAMKKEVQAEYEATLARIRGRI